MSTTQHNIHYVPNNKGWELELKQCRLPKRLNVKRNPVVIVPGYGMNSFIFGYHPSGLSMEEYFTQRGLEVWSVNLRAQGGSRAENGDEQFTLEDWGMTDLRVAVDFIAKRSRSKTGKVDLIGCSLGGTLAFIYTALVPRNRTGSLVAIGAPLRWENVHLLFRIVFAFPELVGMLRFTRTREVLKILFPLLLRSPLLSLYLHKEIVDLRNKDLLLQTVENPNRFINKEIAHWLNNRDLIINGKNLTHEFHRLKNPLFCLLANSDGIVPPMTALSAHEMAGSKIKETLVVGTDRLRFAHADLFVSKYSHDMVFEPIADWLLKVGRKRPVVEG